MTYKEWLHSICGDQYPTAYSPIECVNQVLEDWKNERTKMLDIINLFSSGLGFPPYESVEEALEEKQIHKGNKI